MRAAVLHEFGAPLVVEEVELEQPREREVLVRLVGSGVCRSDLHSARGVHRHPIPTVLGHEGAGIVEETGSGVEHVRAGDHVVLSWLPFCGQCRMCLRGRPVLCENLGWADGGTMMDGTTRLRLDGRSLFHYGATSFFAERAVVPAQCAIPVAPELPLPELALIGCAVATGVGAVLNTAAVKPGENVVVVGCGGVGLSVVQGAVIAEAGRIVAVDRVPAKLELARELGATDVVEASSPEDAVDAVHEVLPDGADHVFEALGRPETIELALRLVGRGGQAILIGMAPPDAEVPLRVLPLTTEERSVKGCWYGSCRPPEDFPRLIELYREGRLRLDLLVQTCALEDVNDAFAAIERGDAFRSVIVFD
jgi:S-(hydroxymethyl)glutathione dehydrogenase / alcohol dehydrogenase